MHFASNYSTNGRLHLLLIRRHIILVDKFGLCWFSAVMQASFSNFLCLMSVAYLSNTILPNTKKKKICTYENRINFITKWGQPMESTEIGR